MQMCDFFGWANSKMAGEYVSTSKAAVKNIASKLQGPAEPAGSSKEEQQLVEAGDDGNDEGNLWGDEGDWTPTEKDLKILDLASAKVPMKIESGAKVFIIQHVENFHC